MTHNPTQVATASLASTGNGKPGTHSEAWRHACEVRYVCSMSKAQRDRYLYGDELRRPPLRPLRAIRGDAAFERLLADAKAHWAARKGGGAPHLPEGSEGPRGAAAVPLGERTKMGPAVGSFPASPHEGPLWRDGCVESGGAA